MKLSWMVTVLMLVCLSVSGEVSKDLKRLVKIDSVRDSEKGSGTKKKLLLRVEFSSEEEGLEAILVRIAVELTDKKTKQVYLAGEMKNFGEMPDGYVGEGYWELSMPYGDIDKLKLTAYVVEFGVMNGGAFVPFLTECDHAKSYDELTGRTAQKFPNQCKLIRMVLVDE